MSGSGVVGFVGGGFGFFRFQTFLLVIRRTANDQEADE
jgi:hypothetical protein